MHAEITILTPGHNPSDSYTRKLRGTPVFLKPDPCVDCMQTPPAINLRVASPGSTQIRTPVTAPVANACVERVTGSLRRKPLDVEH